MYSGAARLGRRGASDAALAGGEEERRCSQREIQMEIQFSLYQ